MAYCLYLRKSRADLEAENHGELETLARHEKLLLSLAKKNHYNVTQIYREVVSGETLLSRPVMQKLLQEVEQGIWEGVLVVEVERLARGETIDQGLVAQAFKQSGTKIITPLKVYDPLNEFDEEYFEFGLYMSRREYKTINRRLQRGRMAAVKEGKSVSSKAPYGYKRVRCSGERGWTLTPVEDEAKVVEYIFDVYVNGVMKEDGKIHYPGTVVIAKMLTNLKIKSPSGKNEWDDTSVRSILSNPVYVGKIRWGYHKTKKIVKDGTIKVTRNIVPDSECVFADGLHPAIISDELFYRAIEKAKSRQFMPLNKVHALSNPLAGIVVCQKCGHRMIQHSGSPLATLMCKTVGCDNIGARRSLVEERILQGLASWVSSYHLELSNNGDDNISLQLSETKKALARIEADTKLLQQQLDRTHDLLEQGIYDTDTFLNRSRSINAKLSDDQKKKEDLLKQQTSLIRFEEKRKSIIPKTESILETYASLSDVRLKNELLKSVLEKVTYIRTVKSPRGGPLDNFEITLFPKLPRDP